MSVNVKRCKRHSDWRLYVLFKGFFHVFGRIRVYKNTKSTKRKRTPLNIFFNVWCDATMMVGAFLSYCIVYKFIDYVFFFFQEKKFLWTHLLHTSTQMMWKRLVSFLGWGKPEYACLEWNLCEQSDRCQHTKVHKHWGVFFGKVIKTDKKRSSFMSFTIFVCLCLCVCIQRE